MSQRPITQFVTGTSGQAVLIPLEYMGPAFQCSIQVVSTGTAVFEVDQTMDPTNDWYTDSSVAANSNGLYTGPVTATSGNWTAVAGLTAAIIVAAGVYLGYLTSPATAIRLRCVTSGTGYAVIRVLQTAVAQ